MCSLFVCSFNKHLNKITTQLNTAVRRAVRGASVVGTQSTGEGRQTSEQDTRSLNMETQARREEQGEEGGEERTGERGDREGKGNECYSMDMTHPSQAQALQLRAV